MNEGTAACDTAGVSVSREVCQAILDLAGERIDYWPEPRIALLDKVGLPNYPPSPMASVS